MTKKNQTKRALISSVIALMLCFSMLVGTTFAWFTDSVSSAKNTIVAGNLDIEVYFAHPDDVVDGKLPDNAWTEMTSETPVFDNDARWEPGYTQLVYFKIKNVGSLAAKYQFKVDILSETPGTNVNGEQFMLSDKIQTYVNACTNRNLFETYCIYTDRDIALNPPGAPNPFYTSLKNAADGTLANDEGENSLKLNHELTLKPADEYDDELYATFVLWMPEEVGNEANFAKDTTPPQIDLGITVVATQWTYEGDSFGNNLDANATYPTVSYPVTRPASGMSGTTTLKGTTDNAVAAEVPAEVINNLPAEVTGVSIAHSEPKYGNGAVSFDDIALVDQNGKEIDLTNNDEYITVTLPKQTVFNVGETVAVYHDGELIGTGIVNEDTTISYVAQHFCQVTVQGMDKVEAEELAGITYYVTDINKLQSTIDNAPAGTTISIKEGNYTLNAQINVNKAVNIVGVGEVKITRTEFGGHMFLVSNADGAEAGFTASIANVNLDALGYEKAGIYVRDNVVLNLDNVTVQNAAWGDLQIDNSSKYNGSSAVINAVNVTAGKVAAIAVGENKAYFNFDNSSIAQIEIQSANCYVNNVAVGTEEVNTYVLKDAASNTYYIYNAEGLAAMNNMMADKSAGRDAIVNLVADVDFTGKIWTPVDSHADTAFEIAELNGNGYTIYNLTINGQAMFRRFAGFGDVVIKDITFDNATVNSTALNASIITAQTYQNVLLDNVDVKNSSITGAYKVAPLIATVYDEKATSITATIKNCDVSNTTVTSTQFDYFTCGLVSFVYTTNNDYVEYENCTITDVALRAVSGGYNYHANIHYTSADTDDQINEHPGVTVTNVTFEKIG